MYHIVPDTCTNEEQDGDETGVDCGGSCPNNCNYNFLLHYDTYTSKIIYQIFWYHFNFFIFLLAGQDSNGGKHLLIVFISLIVWPRTELFFKPRS